MTAFTPIARSKAAALSRVLDSVPKGYTRYTSGRVSADKAERLARKFHVRHGIGATASKRATRLKHGKANALLVMYWPDSSQEAEWLLLFTPGELDSPEQLLDVTDKKRLCWLGYELVRYGFRGKTRWTWRRPKTQMTELFDLLSQLCRRLQWSKVEEVLKHLAAQPGFHGVREQSWRLCEEAKKSGYTRELPFLFYMQKLSHGDRLQID